MSQYTDEQVDCALGILSGRIKPEEMYFDDVQKLYDGELKSGTQGGGKPSIPTIQREAERIVKAFITRPR